MLSAIKDTQDLENNITDTDIDEHGFLINADDWTVAFAEFTLGLESGELSILQLSVIHFIRQKYLRIGALPPVRHVCRATGIEKPELKMMFGSCVQLWCAAGLPLPNDEIKAHMN